MKGNDKCPCGSGLKFKKCCRSKGRDPETCFFCKRQESKEVAGEFCIIEGHDGSKTDAWSCKDCIKKRIPKGDMSILPMMLTMMMGLKR